MLKRNLNIMLAVCILVSALVLTVHISAADTSAPVVVSAAPATVTDGVVTVTVSVKATTPIVATRFRVNAPEGFTLTGVKPVVAKASTSSTGWAIIAQEAVTVPYEATLINMSASDATVNKSVIEFTFAVSDTVKNGAVITVESIETCNAALKDIETVAESAKITVHTCSYKAVITEPTCTDGGYTTYTCSCGDTYVANHVLATGHAYDGVVDPPARPGEVGVKTYTCANCGDVYTEEIPALAAVAEINGVKYETLADAFSAAVAGDTIVVLESITVTDFETWDIADRTLVFDDNCEFYVTGNLTIENGSFEVGALGICVSGSLTINDGTFITEKDGFLVEKDGSINIKGGVFSTDPSDHVMEGFKVDLVDGKYIVVEETVGDVNMDGKVNVLDILELIGAILNGRTVENGDFNGDGEATLIDVLRVMKLLSL